MKKIFLIASLFCFFISNAQLATTHGIIQSAAVTACTTTNLVSYSEQFNNAFWTKNTVTVSSDATTAPDGNSTADKLQETSANDYHYLQPTISSANGTYTASIYAKAAERTILLLDISDGVTGDAYCYFDISAGTITTSGCGGSWSSCSETITSVGSGWYRCTVTGTKGAGSVIAFTIMPVISGTTVSYTGTTGSGFYIWGAQLVTGSSPLCYVQTDAP